MLNRIRKRYKRLGDGGQSTTEYILILAVVVMIALKFKKSISPLMDTATEQIGTQITDALKPN